VDSPGRIGLNGHSCWGYHDLAGDFRDAAVSFLTEGLDLGQALMFVGGPDAEDVVRSVEPLRSMVLDGSLQIAAFDDVYPGGRRMPAHAQWAAYTAATEHAHQGGFTGLRVLAEVSSLASPDRAWLGQSAWERYADRRMADYTLAALCCFDRSAVTPEGLGTIASAHPVVDRRLADLAPFRLFSRGDALAISGEVDAFSSDTLRLLLAAGNGRPDQRLDLNDLAFIDHTGLLVLHQHARAVREQGLEFEIVGGPPSLRRLADLMGVTL
jgi:anti-anti-sigma factor